MKIKKINNGYVVLSSDKFLGFSSNKKKLLKLAKALEKTPNK
jgi:hypothetical protein